MNYLVTIPQRRVDDHPPPDIATFLKRELRTTERLDKHLEALDLVKEDMYGLEWVCFRLSLLELQTILHRFTFPIDAGEREGRRSHSAETGPGIRSGSPDQPTSLSVHRGR